MTFDIIATIILVAIVAIAIIYLVNKRKYNQARDHIYQYFTKDNNSIAEEVIVPLLNKETLSEEYRSTIGNYRLFIELVSEKCANTLMEYVNTHKDEFNFDYKVFEFSIMKDVSDFILTTNLEDKVKDVFYGNINDSIAAGAQDIKEYDEYFDQFVDEETNRDEPSEEDNDDEGVEGCHPEEINEEDYKEEIDRPTTVEELYAKFADIVEDIDDDSEDHASKNLDNLKNQFDNLSDNASSANDNAAKYADAIDNK